MGIIKWISEIKKKFDESNKERKEFFKEKELDHNDPDGYLNPFLSGKDPTYWDFSYVNLNIKRIKEIIEELEDIQESLVKEQNWIIKNQIYGILGKGMPQRMFDGLTEELDFNERVNIIKEVRRHRHKYLIQGLSLDKINPPIRRLIGNYRAQGIIQKASEELQKKLDKLMKQEKFSDK